MPLLTTRGSLSTIAAGFTSGTPYVAPLLLPIGTGQTSTVAPAAYGYSVSGTFGAGTENYYLNNPKTSGKWYFEVVATTSAANVEGVADDISTTVINGGYNSTTNAGAASTVLTWVDAGWTGTANTGTWPGSTTNDVIGIAYDLDSATRTLKHYLNNVLSNTISWTNTPTLYPMICPYGATRLQLGPAGCTYAPPSGYTHI